MIHEPIKDLHWFWTWKGLVVVLLTGQLALTALFVGSIAMARLFHHAALPSVSVTDVGPPILAPAPASAPCGCFVKDDCGRSDCNCHAVGGKNRCWAMPDDCEIDRVCCLVAGETLQPCDGLLPDKCFEKTTHHGGVPISRP